MGYVIAFGVPMALAIIIAVIDVFTGNDDQQKY